MARRTVEQEVLVDDVDGTPIYEGEGRSGVVLAFDDVRVELDLTNKHITEIENVLAPYFKAARNGSPVSRPSMPSPRAATSTADRQAMQEIRKWAKKNGFNVSERGRIPYAVMDAYTKAHLPSRAKAS